MALQENLVGCQQSSARILTIISVVSCAINVACMAVMFSWVYRQGSQCRQLSHDLDTAHVQLHYVKGNNDKNSIYNNINVSENVLTRLTRGTDETKRKKRHRKKCKCKRGKRGPRGKAAEPLRSAHYLSNFQDYEKQKFSLKGSERCLNLESNAVVCRNRTISLQKHTNYNFLHAANWMYESINPILKDKFGAFNVLQSGIYLVYSTTNFYDAKLKLYQVIKVNGNGKLWCMDGIDFVAQSTYSENIRHKTCSITGIMQLNKGDKIEIQNLNPNLTIDITKDRTFFGVVLLHSEP